MIRNLTSGKLLEKEKMMKVLDNFLPKEVFQTIKQLVIGTDIDSSNTSWYWQPCITYIGKPESKLRAGQLTHRLYDTNIGVQSQLYEPIFSSIVAPLYGSNGGLMVKMKLNLNPRTCSNEILGDYHRDTKLKCKTAIFYFNTNNGFTKFKNGDIVECIENRIVIFDSDILHVGYSCTDSQYKLLLNINYFEGPIDD